MFTIFRTAFVRSCSLLAMLGVQITSDAAFASKDPLYSCPVKGANISQVPVETPFVDIRGIRYYLCRKECAVAFAKNSEKYLKKKAQHLVGLSLFDPVTTKRIDEKDVKSSRHYAGIRYLFVDEKSAKLFEKSPKKYAKQPTKHLLFCPVSKELVKSYAEASDYSDMKGERIYFCCPGCKEPFDKDPAKFASAIATYKASQTKGSEKP